MNTYYLRNLRFPVRQDYDLEEEISAKLRIKRTDFHLDEITRKALDTRKHDHPIYDFTVQLSFPGKAPRHLDLSEYAAQKALPSQDINTSDPHPFIIGMGPAGLFCALAMVKNGLQPWLFDQGDPLEERATKVNAFWQSGILDESSNVQFGEGGAGAFSDGKLTNRGKDPHIQQVFAEMVSHGANPEICFEALPHLGTDGIRAMVKSIREFLIAKGCQFHYRSKLEDISISDGRIKQVRINGQSYAPEIIIAGLGNSSRNTFRMLHKRGISLEPKPFALGIRIEQDQASINEKVYGSGKWADILGAATYRLTAPTGFTFCMCPGGQVIAASSEAGSIVTNGMSFAARNDRYCNSAVVTSVTASDYGEGLWAGMNLQDKIEKQSWQKGFLAPAQAAEDFVLGNLSNNELSGTYKPGVYSSDLQELFPAEVSSRLRAALVRFDQILKGFYQDAVLVAPETRTSSPLRIPRDKDLLCSLDAENFYPIGEGSGYAGGIVSSAVDGWRVGERMRLST